MTSSRHHRVSDCLSEDLDDLDMGKQGEMEQRSFLNPRQQMSSRTARISIFNRLMAGVNLILGVILAVSLIIVARSARISTVTETTDPYCEYSI